MVPDRVLRGGWRIYKMALLGFLFLSLFLIRFWSSPERPLRPKGSIWCSFGSCFGHFQVTFGGMLEFVEIDAPLKRKPTFRGSEVSISGTFSSLFAGLDSMCFFCVFLWMQGLFRCPLAPQMVSFGAPLDLQLGVISDHLSAQAPKWVGAPPKGDF